MSAKIAHDPSFCDGGERQSVMAAPVTLVGNANAAQKRKRPEHVFSPCPSRVFAPSRPPNEGGDRKNRNVDRRMDGRTPDTFYKVI